LRGFNEVDQRGLADAWGDAIDGRMPPPLLHRDAMPQFAEFERIYGQTPATPEAFNMDGQWSFFFRTHFMFRQNAEEVSSDLRVCPWFK
jgi:hypothetical protein